MFKRDGQARAGPVGMKQSPHVTQLLLTPGSPHANHTVQAAFAFAAVWSVLGARRGGWPHRTSFFSLAHSSSSLPF